MRVSTNSDVSLHWREDGDPDGFPVVFANSLGTDLRLWDDVVSLLPSGLRLIRFDLRGHGLSDVPQGPYSISDLAGDTEALIDSLGIQSCVFVGLSIGGMIAQALAAKRPDLIQALVLSNTALKMGSPGLWAERIAAIRKSGLESLGDTILLRWFGARFRAKPEAQLWKNMLTHTPVEGYIGCCEAIAEADLTQSTKQLDLPVLVIAGSEDQASPPDQVQAMANAISGAAYQEIDGAGHLPCVEAPEKYTEILSSFLKEHANELTL